MKKPVSTYQERERLALEGMRLKIASDPAEPPEHRLAARQALSTPSPTEIVAAVEDHAGANRVAALQALRSYVSGEPVVNHAALVTAPAPELPESDQGELVTEPPVPTRPVRQVKQATEQASPPAPMPGAYVPKVRKIEYGKYIDSDEDLAARNRDEIRRIKG